MNLVLETGLRWATRLVLLAAGLLATATVAALALLAAASWLLYAGWARLSGRPVALRLRGLDPRSLLSRLWRRPRDAAPGPAASKGESRTPRADANRGRAPRRRFDISDVQPRPPRA